MRRREPTPPLLHLTDLITRLLEYDPAQRLPAADALRHPFVAFAAEQHAHAEAAGCHDGRASPRPAGAGGAKNRKKRDANGVAASSSGQAQGPQSPRST